MRRPQFSAEKREEEVLVGVVKTGLRPWPSSSCGPTLVNTRPHRLRRSRPLIAYAGGLALDPETESGGTPIPGVSEPGDGGRDRR